MRVRLNKRSSDDMHARSTTPFGLLVCVFINKQNRTLNWHSGNKT